MNKLITFCLSFLLSFTLKAQTTSTADCNCPTPKGGKFLYFCTLVENKDVRYKDEILQMSCADPLKDSKETIRRKVNCMWEKYYFLFGCDNTGFLVPQGNILKYAVNQEFELFVDAMVEEWDVSINMKDPADGKTLLDFTLDEIIRYKKEDDKKSKVRELERIYNHFKNDLYALHASELTTKPQYQWGVKINLAKHISIKYIGAYSLDKAPENVYTVIFENDKLLMSLNGSKYSELHAESENTFFLLPENATRYRFTKNKESKYDLTFGSNKATMVN